MAGLIPPLTLALAQVDSRVGDLEGNAARIAAEIERARDAGAELVLFPELALTGYPPEDLLLKEHFLQASTRGDARAGPRGRGDRGAGRLPGASRRRLQRARRAGRRHAPGRLSQVGAPQLRRVRRAALLPGRRGRRGARAGRRAARPDDLRGRLDSGAACFRRGPRRRRADPRRVRVALPRRQGRRTGADADPARARQPGGRRLLQPRRRPGRARLRRPLAR